VLSICISIVTSSVVVKTLVPTLPTFTATPTSGILPTATLTLTQTPVVETPTRSPASLPDALTPMKIEMPKIESNLLQNSGFEDDLSGWTYSDRVAGISVFETAGINGKAFCSRRYTANKELLEKESAAFVQEVPIDPTQAYFFSGWVKLNRAIHVYAMARLYHFTKKEGWALATHRIGILPDGETTDGWVLIHGEISMIPPGTGTNRVLFGLWHGLIYDAPNGVDSTICVDDLVFGRIIK
jgi:hypothetical protein